MTLIFLKKNKSFLILLIGIFFFNISFSQQSDYGSPFVFNLSPKEYGFESSNYSIAQDNEGIMYFGNLSGILQYDGSVWRLIKINGKPILSSCKNETIYVGGYNEIGYLSKENSENVQYISIISKLPVKDRNFGNITKVIAFQDFVLYCNDKLIYKYDGNKIELINSSNEYINAFEIDGSLYIYKYGYGLLKYSGSLFKLIPNGHFFKDKLIQDIIPYGNDLLIKIIDKKGFLIYNYNSIKEFVPEYCEFLYTNGYCKGLLLKNGNYFYATKRCGAIIVNKNGKKIASINKSNGLYTNNINFIFADNDNNIWIALNNGISKVEYPSPYSFFNENSGIDGGVYSIIKYNNSLHISSSLGVYYMSAILKKDFSCSSTRLFTQIDYINFQCYNFYTFFGKLYFTSENGLYEIINKKAKLISSGKIRAIHQLESDTSIVILGRYDGVYLLKYNNSDFIELGKVNGFDKYIRTIAEDSNHNIWLGSDYEGVHKMKFINNNYLNPNIENLNKDNGLHYQTEWVDVYSTSKGVIFSTNMGIYLYRNNAFIHDTLLNIKNIKPKWYFPLVEDKNKNLWFSSGFDGKYEKTTGCFINNNTTILNKIKNFTVECIYPDKDSIVWLGGFDGLIRYDANYSVDDTISKQIIIKKIKIGKDSLINYKKYCITDNFVKYYNDSIINEISYKYNDIRFEYSMPSFDFNSKISYTFFLEGFDKKWSEPSTTNFKEYTNLWEGNYIFQVKAIDTSNKETFISEYKFKILSPYYRRWWAYFAFAVIITLFIIMIAKWRSYIHEKEKNKLDKIISERTEELVLQKERAEILINNILPSQTVEELKSVGRVSRKKYKMVTVLFSDIKEFTKIVEDISQEKLIDELDKYFLHFDGVVDKYNIEKIKTIGDAYMCAGGIPQKNRTNPIEVVLAAIEMRKYLSELKKHKEEIWDVRIGIHTGSVIAGIVGSKKYSYDIWGDTVNIASRMESLGQPGEINISETTYDMVKEYFDCELRGKVPAKYKGEINMFFVKGLKKEFCNIDGLTPNRKFYTKLQLIRFDDLDELIMTKLEKGLPKTLYYHDLKHTIDVCTQVEIIGRMEKISDEEMLLLKTAALFHDAGFLIGYDDHEFLGIKMAKETLPKFGYSDEQIKVISDLIFATRMPPKPTNHLEQIICDADLDYLGRPDFIPVSQKLFRELFERNKIKSVEEWNKMQIKFIESHHYFTETARNLRSENKIEQLDKLKRMMNMA